jgi:hypothetical protein
MSESLRNFKAICKFCGPAIFNYLDGKTADDDCVWCTACQHQQTFADAETEWHSEEPADSNTLSAMPEIALSA